MNWSAEALRARFAVHGRFYNATLDGRDWCLRSHLEIFDSSLQLSSVISADADLVAVMMNPGASRPLTDLDAQGWAPAIPDRTQYQLMKLALRAQSSGRAIRHIRVINLSDLRTPRSALLFEALAELTDGSHSIFSPKRATELKSALGGGGSPVLRAWGLGKQLEPLARLALAASSSRSVLGLTGDGLHYRHPLPQRADLQAKWLDAMCIQMDRLA